MRARGARSAAVASAGTDAVEAPSRSISRWAFSTATACSVPAPGTWLRRSGFEPSAAAGLGGFAEPPFVIVIVARPPCSGPPRRLLQPPIQAGEMTRPSPPGEGPVGLRWSVALRAPVPPRSPVLSPPAGNEAYKALKPDQERANKGEKGYLERVILDRHLHTASIARHDDGDSAAIQSIRDWHGPGSLRVHRSMCNHPGAHALRAARTGIRGNRNGPPDGEPSQLPPREPLAIRTSGVRTRERCRCRCGGPRP